MVIHSPEELIKIERGKNERRKRLVNKKPDLVHIEHVDYTANILRRHNAQLRSPCLDDGKNMTLPEFKGEE